MQKPTYARHAISNYNSIPAMYTYPHYPHYDTEQGYTVPLSDPVEIIQFTPVVNEEINWDYSRPSFFSFQMYVLRVVDWPEFWLLMEVL